MHVNEFIHTICTQIHDSISICLESYELGGYAQWIGDTHIQHKYRRALSFLFKRVEAHTSPEKGNIREAHSVYQTERWAHLSRISFR